MKFAFKKEFMYFSRTARLAGIIVTILALALLDPLIFKASQLTIVTMQEMLAEYGTEMNMDPLLDLLDLVDAGSVAASVAADLTTTSIIIITLVLSQPAGGEQKKRSVIIPQCAGLTPPCYAVPKFVIYPLALFVLGFIAMPIAVLIAQPMFGGSVPVGIVLSAAFEVGLYLAFLTALELTIGICTEKPTMAALFTIFSAYIMPVMFAVFGASKFHPFALPTLARQTLVNGEADTLNFVVSSGVTIVLMLILLFTTLFALTAKKVENGGNDPAL